jgi:putative zinc finger protein
MTRPDHLTNDLLIRAMDDELSANEESWVRLHLAQCGECHRNYQQFGALSSRVESLVSSVDLPMAEQGRDKLSQLLEGQERKANAKSPKKAAWRLGWGMGMAAVLAVAVLFIPRGGHTPGTVFPTEAAVQPVETFEVADETFVALPYSNPDLPLNAPEIVQMRVPISSLADAGIYDAASMGPAFEDESVLADVLLGADGEPLGVHVLAID